MAIEKRFFGNSDENTPIYLYKITNAQGASVTLQTLGAGIQSLCMPDRDGNLADVVLGFDDPKLYTDPDYGYQGLTVGRWANRIRDGKFTFHGRECHTPQNQGSWTLHGGGRFSFTPWEVAETGDDYIVFSRFSPDGEDGFPGDFTMTVKYTLTQDNVLRIEYTVNSDVDTVANPTNHAYFNLSGDPNKTVEAHTLQILADAFTETDASQLPTGVLSPVKGTMMDFTQPHPIGDRIDEPFRAVIDGVGYDNNYCLRSRDGSFAPAAVLADPSSGRKMTVVTDLPGLQLYCGGWLSRDYTVGKGDSLVTYRRGVALETQFYPDTVNFPDSFPFWYVKGGVPFTTVTEFRFTADA